LKLVVEAMLKPHHFFYKCPPKISDLEQTEGRLFLRQVQQGHLQPHRLLD